jgi:hypothetical protein
MGGSAYFAAYGFHRTGVRFLTGYCISKEISEMRKDVQLTFGIVISCMHV